MADAVAGWVEPTQATKYLDAESTNRTVDGVEVVRERVHDPDVFARLQEILDTLDSIDLTLTNPLTVSTGLNLSPLATHVKQDEQTTLLQLIADNTDGLELQLTDLDVNTDELETILSNVFVELGEKLQAEDISILATAANQSTQITRLTEIRDKDFATENTISKRFAGGKTQESSQINSLGDNTVIEAAPSERIRLFWLGMSTSENNGAEVLTIVKFGDNEHYRWNMGAPGAFSHWEVIEGALGEDLVINLSAAQAVEASYTYEVF